ncbi:hypothetical protein F5Y16DRAFT_424010 [Xylariaceae sp. FL0255]|nr:hypothetical protein F5Y16DRAFT_424010 [Xylariaceae sp. FL0255]
MNMSTPYGGRHTNSTSSFDTGRTTNSDFVQSTEKKRSRFEVAAVDDPKNASITTSRTRKQGLRAQCARFRWWYVIAAIVALAVSLPILFLVVIPAIAQDMINKTDLPIYGGTVQALTANTLSISLNTGFSIPSGITIKLDPFVLSLYNKSNEVFTPFLDVPLAAQTVHGKSAIDVTNETVAIADLDAFNTWLTTTLDQDNTTIGVKGNTTAHLGLLHFHVNLKKTVTINGLRQLSGASISDARLDLPAAADGSNIVGHITMPNWSDLNTGSVLIANVKLQDAYLPSGNTTFPFRGQIYIDAVIENIGEVLAAQDDLFGRGQVSVRANGNSTVVDGEHIPYFEDLLNNAHIGLDVPLAQLLGDIATSALDGDLTLSGLGTALNSSDDLLTTFLDDLANDLGSSDNSSSNPSADLLGDLNLTSLAVDKFRATAKDIRDAGSWTSFKNKKNKRDN